MYEAFYGLNERPFSILPDPGFLFWADTHTSAFSMLEYGVVANTGITVITGEVGAGKTTLIRYLLNQLPDELTVGLVSNIQPGRGTLLDWIMMSLDIRADSRNYVDGYRAFQDFLIENYSRGKRTVIIIDEAQTLDYGSLEELRMMSNINVDKHHLMQIILSGQPELRQTLSSPDLKQFTQRVTSDYHLGLLKQEEVSSYINSRLAIAGASRALFTREACQAIYIATKGTPRLINSLCDRCLTYGYADNAPRITENIVSAVLEDLMRFGALERNPT